MNPLATNHPISWFKKHHLDGNLDLSPTFQRKPVWSDYQASYLVDSILNNLPVPEVFLRTITTQDGDSRVEVVDGQQRLRAIIRFFSGDLSLSGPDVSESWRGTEWSDLSGPQRAEFWSYKIVTREMEGVSDAEVRDMFRRLNSNQSSLNDQELRHSQYSGQFISLVEELADDPWWIENRIVAPAQVRRMIDAEFVAELLVGLISGPLDKKHGLDDFFADYDDEFPDADIWKRTFKKVRTLAYNFCSGDLTGWRSKTEFYSLFLACGQLLDTGSLPKAPEAERVMDSLSTFRAKADQAKKKDRASGLPQYCLDYAEAVTRASTDLGRRLYRISVVASIIQGKTPPRA